MRRIGLPVACALLCAGPFCFKAVADSDPGWHVAVGRLVLGGSIPRTNALSWAYGSTPWYATSWLYDAALAELVRIFPQALGAQLLTFALLAATLVALAWACDREGSAWILPAIALLLVPRLVPRPHVASWAILAAVLALAPRSTPSRTVCLLLVALGGNLHSGAAFAAGILGFESLEAFWRTRRRAELLIAAGAGIALVANPGLLFDARYLLEHLGHVNEVVALQEFEPPLLLRTPAFFVLLPVSLLFAVQRRRERPAQLVAVVVFAALGLHAQRMASEAQIVWAPALAAGLSRVRLPALPGIAAAILAGMFVPLDPAQRPFSIEWDERLLPVRAARFLEEKGIAGPGFNAFRDGGYLEMARPGVPAFIDGRVQAFPEGALLDLQENEKTAAAFQAWLRRLGCEWAITTRVRERMGGWHLLHESPEWALVYWDDASEIYVRRGVPRFASLRDYRAFVPWGHVIERKRAAELPLLFEETERFLRTSPHEPFALIVRCAALHGMNAPGAAAACDLHVPPSMAPKLERARSFQAAP